MARPKKLEEKIVKAAIAVFAAKGYSAARTADIAEAAGCAEGSIFRYFPKKIDLLTRVARQTIQTFAAGFAEKGFVQTLEKTADQPLEDMLEALLMERITFAAEQAHLLRIVITEMQYHEELRDMYREAISNVLMKHAHTVTKRIREKVQVRDEIEDEVLTKTLLGIMFSQLGLYLLLDMEMDMDTVRCQLKQAIHIFCTGIQEVNA